MDSTTPVNVPENTAQSPSASGTGTDPNYQPPEGRVGNLTDAQTAALAKFKKELQDEDYFVEERMDDATLLRFLRARQFDVAKAKVMIITEEKWRKEYKVDELYKTFKFTEKADVDKYYPRYYHKTDKDGRPLYIERLNRFNASELAKVTSPERQLQSLVVEYEKSLKERMPECSRAVGHPIETSCTILDLENTGFFAFMKVRNFVQDAAHIGQNYYPETMGKFYIINAGRVFTKIWSYVKGYLDPVTVEKINILEGNGVTELLKQIPAENLPKDLGGKCECPGGCSLSDAGPWNGHDVDATAVGETPSGA